MEQFLTEEVEKKFKRITLEYVYSSDMLVGDRIKRSIYSFREDPHSQILINWMAEGFITYDDDAYEQLQFNHISIANDIFASLGEMIIHINHKAPFNLLYCPKDLVDYQQLRLRLWYEYFVKQNQFFSISCSSGNRTIAYDASQVESYLEEQSILDDQLMRSLVRKYPNFE